jgi:hypothetical protein
MKNNLKDADSLFGDLEHPILSEWEGMPEYMTDKVEPYCKVIVRFRNEQDLQEFAELVGQALNKKTKSMWFPSLYKGLHSNKRYVDET